MSKLCYNKVIVQKQLATIAMITNAKQLCKIFFCPPYNSLSSIEFQGHIYSFSFVWDELKYMLAHILSQTRHTTSGNQSDAWNFYWNAIQSSC